MSDPAQAIFVHEIAGQPGMLPRLNGITEEPAEPVCSNLGHEPVADEAAKIARHAATLDVCGSVDGRWPLAA